MKSKALRRRAYFGGRAECKIRNTPVPVVLTDFSSQYPTVNSLLGIRRSSLPRVCLSKMRRKRFGSSSEKIQFDDCFDQNIWKRFKFFALVRPDNDVFPVRAEYSDDGVTKNIATNCLTSDEPIWFSGPDVIQSKLLSGKVPKIEKAIRMIPHGQQKGMQPTNLRGMVEVDPRRDDLFCRMVEQKTSSQEIGRSTLLFPENLRELDQLRDVLRVNATAAGKAGQGQSFLG